MSKQYYDTFNNFEHSKLPDPIKISGKLVKNKLHLFFIMSKDRDTWNGAKELLVIIDEKKNIFYGLRDMKVVEQGNLRLYHVVIEGLEYNKRVSVQAQLKSKWGLSERSNIIYVTPIENSTSSSNLVTNEESEKENYISCHPDGTYTISNKFIVSPPIVSNLTTKLLEDIQEKMKPKEKTYKVEINLE